VTTSANLTAPGIACPCCHRAELALAADGVARPVALSRTLGGAWDGVLRCHLRGTIVIAPTDPPRRPERAADEAQDREAA
jgi:hypothetical protein